jgi:hypothetical protein
VTAVATLTLDVTDVHLGANPHPLIRAPFVRDGARMPKHKRAARSEQRDGQDAENESHSHAFSLPEPIVFLRSLTCPAGR